MLETKLKTWMRSRLHSWFAQHARTMPWRGSRHPYAIWISEIMLQQTQVKTVLPYYSRFMRKFPTAKVLAQAKLDEVLKQWEGLGYYSRARHLHQAANRILNERQGRFPRSAEEWRTLPGVGEYTSGAIASIAFDERVVAIDGNVKRVMSRFFNLQGFIEQPPTMEKIRSLTQALIPARQPGDFNQALMEIGALVCLPQNPDCMACPWQARCQGLQAGMQNSLPRRSKRKKLPRISYAVLWVRSPQGDLMIRRPERGLLGGLWEFPNLRLLKRQTPRQAAQKLGRKLGWPARKVGPEIARIEQAYSHFIQVWHVFALRLPLAPVQTAGYAWVSARHRPRLALTGVSRKLLQITSDNQGQPG